MKMPMKVEAQFKSFLLAELAKAKSFGYTPSKLLGDIEVDGAYNATARLLGKPDPTDGYGTLVTNNHPQLTLEALVLEHEWHEYFDDALLQIADKRLRLSKYIPRVMLRRTDVLLSVEWANTIEHIPLNLASLSTRTEIQTIERSKTLEWEASYDVRCIDIERNVEGWEISLQYDSTYLRNKVLAKDPTYEWGVTLLTIDAGLSRASAVFTPEGNHKQITGKVRFFETSLYQKLSRAQMEVLLRPGQAALRKRLLKDSTRNRCAVSNESCPDVLEVAHIVDHSSGGVAGEQNAMLLRADLHSLFDSGLLVIDRSGSITLRRVPQGSLYHAEKALWNKRLSEVEFGAVKAALRERERLLAKTGPG
ncbi:HNH endonuclease signature motif containing protein [Achromobacter sp. SIMBA_011]|uniref:HNH endonuclease n=1 Tax=Achromobacter sp. SIMBA_011 TaxID=3085759 RepID=UPI00397BA22D